MANPWLVPVAIVVLLSLIVWTIVGRSSDPSVGPVITSSSQANEVAQEAESLSLPRLRDLQDGEELTDSDKKNFRRSAALFDSLSDYRPGDIRPYVGAAKLYQALHNDDAAIKRLQRGLASMAPVTAPELTDTAIEAHYLLSESLFNKRDYPRALKEIDIAVKLYPNSPIYLSQRASTYIQMTPHRYPEATHDLLQALTIDPKHQRSLGLLKLIGMSAGEAFKNSAAEKLNASDFAGVVADCTKGLEVDAAYSKLRALRAAANIKLGKRDQARADVDFLLAQNPQSEDAKTLLTLMK